ncbi:rRNA maturation RNase YbeY [Palleronia aestuarii]
MSVETMIEAKGWAECGLPGIADRAALAVLGYLKLDGPFEIALLGCDDERIAALNAEFRTRPRPTNVLSWPSEDRAAARDGDRPPAPDGSDPELGDIAIAFETCAREAVAAGVPLAQHATHLVVHAVLHLLGYDHERPGDAELMEGTEVEILAQLGYPDPYTVASDA